MENRNFVKLNINPCKMCMPMGAVMAFKGIEDSMIVLHGSQGCSTYIRRHMAGHFNEPIDVASSSLSEEGTVYGGASNLKKALANVIKLYSPKVIGVATTCLAETIGEDIKRIIQEFDMERDGEGINGDKVDIIPIATPGYGGTNFEGYNAALLSIVTNLCKETEANNKVNVILSNMNPGDVRNIKAILESFGIDYILLPDVSNTLDAPYDKKFRRIPKGGTKVSDITKMGGALATIEIGMTVPDKMSPGEYLKEKFNVPLYRCAMPVGISNTDAFMDILKIISEKDMPAEHKEARGRLIDGMIDSHKFNAEGRAVIFGEPELSYAVGMLCIENGIKPLLISTGAESPKMKELFKKTFNGENIKVLDDTDFDTIRDYAVKLGANVLIGNSDGKVITEKEDIPLVRVGFPIHDRVGGQRKVITGYNGSLDFLDDITNTLLEAKYSIYREKMYHDYFKEERVMDMTSNALTTREDTRKDMETDGLRKISYSIKTKDHPCYSGGACKIARMHIPVAPECNIKCNYCNRKYDCQNESRPGVTSEVLTPEEARIKFLKVKEKMGNLKVVGIAGPGDALANFENTIKSIELIRREDPDIIICLSTNGLMLPYYADDIIDAGVSHVTITINAIDPEIGAKIYKVVNFRGRNFIGVQGAEILIRNQLSGLKYLSQKGVICKVNIVMIKGINDEHIEEVVKKVKEYGAFITNIMPLIPAKGSAFEDMPQTSNKELNELRNKCSKHIKQMYHCKQCRADAIGTLEQDVSMDFRKVSSCEEDALESNKEKYKPYTFAVATSSGMYIDKHFGHVEEFYIFNYWLGSINFLEKRSVTKYCDGPDECDSEESKIDKIIKTIADCDGVLALRIGYNPQKRLEEMGIKVFQTCGSIEEGIKSAVDEISQVIKFNK
jgi:nitrogenase molybdenum-iron protein alpha/beta subunit/MoaA/NifB/PqqE/SkfB family radical SAM enzyme